MVIMTSQTTTVTKTRQGDDVSCTDANITNSHGDAMLGTIVFSDPGRVLICTTKDAFGRCNTLFGFEVPKFTMRQPVVIPLKDTSGRTLGEIQVRNEKRRFGFRLHRNTVSIYSISCEGRTLTVHESHTENTGHRWSIYDELENRPIAVISEEWFYYDETPDKPYRHVISHHVWALDRKSMDVSLFLVALFLVQRAVGDCYGGPALLMPVPVPTAEEERWFPASFMQACERDEFRPV